MKRGGAVLLMVLLAGCAPPRQPVQVQPSGAVAVNSSGNVNAGAGIDTGRVAIGANTNGDAGVAVDLGNRSNVGVTVGIGTGGRGGIGFWF